jgi:hypothetical protein
MANRLKKALTLLVSGLFLFCTVETGVAQAPTLQFSQEAQAVYHQVTGLQSALASTSLQKLQLADPHNQIGAYIRHLQDFLFYMLTEDPIRYNQFIKRSELHLGTISQVAESNPWRAYCLGEMYMMIGIAAYKRNELILATRSFRSGLKQLRKGAADFPHFQPLQKDRHVIEALIGTVPNQYQWAAELVTGLEAGNDGAKALSDVYHAMQASNHFLAQDAGFFLALTYAHQYRKPDIAHQIAITLQRAEPNHPFILFLFAYTASENGMQTKAIRALEKHKPGAGQIDFPYLNYMLGKYRLRHLDIPGARLAFQQFLLRWQGPSYQAETWQKLGWCALLEDDHTTYHNYIARSLKAPKSPLEGDQQARHEALEKHEPHPALLRARLASDGHNAARAKTILAAIQPETLKESRLQLEHAYRFGRVLAELGETDPAIHYYTQAWRKGNGGKLHFACASALQLGMMYSDLGKPQNARLWYDRCLAEKPAIYRSGLHQKAKAGIRQLID